MVKYMNALYICIMIQDQYVINFLKNLTYNNKVSMKKK
jgi:hypothetical protein